MAIAAVTKSLPNWSWALIPIFFSYAEPYLKFLCENPDDFQTKLRNPNIKEQFFLYSTQLKYTSQFFFSIGERFYSEKKISIEILDEDWEGK